MPATAEERTREAFQQYLTSLEAARAKYESKLAASRRTDIDDDLRQMAKESSDEAYKAVNRLETRVLSWANEELARVLKTSNARSVIFDAIAGLFPTKQPSAETVPDKK